MGLLDFFRKKEEPEMPKPNTGFGQERTQPRSQPGQKDELGLPELGQKSFAEPGTSSTPTQRQTSPPTPGPSPSPPSQPSSSQSRIPSPSQPSMPSTPSPTQKKEKPSFQNKDLELINNKLDTIKAMIDSLDHRVANLERIARSEEKPPYKW